MLIREMKSDLCLCSTPVHTGSFLIGILSLILEASAILFEISSHTEDKPSTQINASELAGDQIKTFEYAGYFSDKIVVGSGLLRHLFYYVLHVVGFIAAILLIYGNRKSLPKLYIPFLAIGVAEIVVAFIELIVFVVAIFGIKSGAYPDIPTDSEELRSAIVFFLNRHHYYRNRSHCHQLVSSMGGLAWKVVLGRISKQPVQQ
ncbi:hypothetical protein M3Y97_00184600 [Aphelenchoides bicaudatus]|nr:hypothetical protein M3Y97_00184600 [Aphelenchoides bicaudatus]